MERLREILFFIYRGDTVCFNTEWIIVFDNHIVAVVFVYNLKSHCGDDPGSEGHVEDSWNFIALLTTYLLNVHDYIWEKLKIETEVAGSLKGISIAHS